MVRCSLCHREVSEEGYCGYHRDAQSNLVAAYEEWKKSTEFNWSEFLKEIIQAKETGEWAKDTARDLLFKGSMG